MIALETAQAPTRLLPQLDPTDSLFLLVEMHLIFQRNQTTKDFKRMSKLNALEVVGLHSQYLCDIIFPIN